jgi:hypothetical protein
VSVILTHMNSNWKRPVCSNALLMSGWDALGSAKSKRGGGGAIPWAPGPAAATGAVFATAVCDLSAEFDDGWPCVGIVCKCE